jgi:Flp pilus assembly CpaE family ATPase
VGLPVAACVGNDFGAVSRAVNAGALVQDQAPRSVVARDVEALAAQLAPEPSGAARPSLLRKIFARAGAVHGAE